MKFVLTILLTFTFLIGKATTYYVSALGSGTQTGLTQANSMSYISVQFFSLSPLDIVLFKRGDVFPGSLATVAGTSGNVITYDAYGSGANPIISGFTTVTGWAQVGATNVWYATLNMGALVLRVVTVDGVNKAMGRYPNTGYLSYEHHTANSVIVDDNLTGTMWTGAEVVIRKSNRWILDRHPITNHFGTTITYSSSCCAFGDNSVALPADSNGYFFQNRSITLDVDGEWYDSIAANRLYIYSTTNPNSRVIKASTVETLSFIHSYTTMNNIDFEGGQVALDGQGGQTNFTANLCGFRFQGGWSFYGQNNTNLTISNCTITDGNNTGIAEADGGSFVSITGNTLTNIGNVAGASMSGDGGRRAITIEGSNNSTMNNNTVRNVGLHGIYFTGNNATVRYNRVDSFALVTDDGGGIYTYAELIQIRSGIVISDNIISNGIGAFAGAWSYYYENYGLAHGIYLDGYTNHVTANNNTISECDAYGIMENGNKDNVITNNVSYNNRWGIAFMQYEAGRISGITVTGNEFIAKQTWQRAAYLRRNGTPESPSVWGTVNNNWYARPIADNTTMNTDTRANYPSTGVEDITLATWKTRYLIDAASSASGVTTALLSSFKFDYNYTGSPVTIPLTAIYKDVRGATYQTSYSLPAYSGKVLVLFASSVPAGGSIMFRGKVVIVN